MHHCTNFRPDVVYCLEDTNLFTSGKLSAGFCPKCGKLVIELYDIRFDGDIKKVMYAGSQAYKLFNKLKTRILYTIEGNKRKERPYGWKYGINKEVKRGGKTVVKQYACDFYGNKEVIKTIS